MELACVRQGGSESFVKNNHAFMNVITREFVWRVAFVSVSLGTEGNIATKNM